jgi:hypothetical protein
VAAAAVCAVVSASAFAVALPEFSGETGATGTIGASTFETTSALLGKITSPKGTSTTTATSKQAGKFHITFEEVVCHGPLGETGAGKSLGDSSGTVLVLGEYKVVRLSSGHAGIWLLLEPVHIECAFSSGSLLLVVSESVLGEITPVLTKTAKYELKVEGSKGKQNITQYENDAGAKVTEGLKTSIDEGTAVASSQNSLEGKLTMAKEVTLEKTT